MPTDKLYLIYRMGDEPLQVIGLAPEDAIEALEMVEWKGYFFVPRHEFYRKIFADHALVARWDMAYRIAIYEPKEDDAV